MRFIFNGSNITYSCFDYFSITEFELKKKNYITSFVEKHKCYPNSLLNMTHHSDVYYSLIL